MDVTIADCSLSKKITITGNSVHGYSITTTTTITTPTTTTPTTTPTPRVDLVMSPY